MELSRPRPTTEATIKTLATLTEFDTTAKVKNSITYILHISMALFQLCNITLCCLTEMYHHQQYQGHHQLDHQQQQQRMERAKQLKLNGAKRRNVSATETSNSTNLSTVSPTGKLITNSILPKVTTILISYICVIVKSTYQ